MHKGVLIVQIENVATLKKTRNFRKKCAFITAWMTNVIKRSMKISYLSIIKPCLILIKLKKILSVKKENINFWNALKDQRNLKLTQKWEANVHNGHVPILIRIKNWIGICAFTNAFQNFATIPTTKISNKNS